MRVCSLHMQPSELAHVAGFGNNCSGSLAPDMSKTGPEGLKKRILHAAQRTYDAKSLLLRVIYSSPDGRGRVQG